MWGFVFFTPDYNFCFSWVCLSCVWKFKRGDSDLQTASLAKPVPLGNANSRVFAGNVINCRCSFPFCYTMAARLPSCIACGLTASQFAFPAFPSLADVISMNSTTTRVFFFFLELRTTFHLGRLSCSLSHRDVFWHILRVLNLKLRHKYAAWSSSLLWFRQEQVIGEVIFHCVPVLDLPVLDFKWLKAAPHISKDSTNYRALLTCSWQKIVFYPPLSIFEAEKGGKGWGRRRKPSWCFLTKTNG